MFIIQTKKKKPKLHFNEVLFATIIKEMMYSGINHLPFPQTVNCVLSHCVNSDKILVQILVQVAMITMPHKLLKRFTYRKNRYIISIVLTKTR